MVSELAQLVMHGHSVNVFILLIVIAGQDVVCEATSGNADGQMNSRVLMTLVPCDNLTDGVERSGSQRVCNGKFMG